MAYQICKSCSKMFAKNGKLYCGDCIVKVEKERDLIVDYVRKHQNATIIDIISATGVSFKSINSLVDDGYVSYREDKLEGLDDKDMPKIKGKFHIRKND